MDKLAVLACCALLLAGAANAFPGSASWRRAAQESNPDRDVEEVEPVRGGGSRGGFAPRPEFESAPSDDSPQVIPFAISIGSLGGLGGYGGRRPILAIRPLGPVAVARDDEDVSDEDGGFGAPPGYLHPYLINPMSNFMAQMAEMIAAMRRQMTEVMQRGSPDDGTPDFSKLGNTTSTTKVIDGHVITVNETVIDSDGDVVRVRTIDIHPSESPESAEEGPATDAKDDSNANDKSDAGKDASKDDATTDSSKDASKDVEVVGSDEVTARPNRAENEIPMKVGSEVDDLNA